MCVWSVWVCMGVCVWSVCVGVCVWSVCVGVCGLCVCVVCGCVFVCVCASVGFWLRGRNGSLTPRSHRLRDAVRDVT